MMNTKRTAIYGMAIWAAAIPALAQPAAPNSLGVAMGHYHLFVQNVETQRNFWMTLGGVPATRAGVATIRFPGVFLIIEQAGPRAGTEGSAVNHIGFKVHALKDAVDKFEAGGWKASPTSNPKQMFIAGPDGVKVELIEDASVAGPAESHHVHFFTPDPLAMQAWYAKMFGAIPGRRAQFDAADIPGANLTFSRATAAVAPSKGRAVDHVGFEVKDLESSCKRLEAAGVTFEQRSKTAAMLTDPWGASIELTEGLSAH
jgi:catechol 2,3-dioxygenase-like lactoylglutathione lyase family enzyme